MGNVIVIIIGVEILVKRIGPGVVGDSGYLTRLIISPVALGAARWVFNPYFTAFVVIEQVGCAKSIR